MEPILEVRRLVKRYRQVTAVDGVSFTCGPGTCFGLLGPNGAGKTTTIEMTEGIIDPGEGEILYRGRPRGAEFRQQVGIMFQHTALLDFLTIRETLETFRAFYRRPEDLEALVERCRLGEIQHRMNNRVSGGQRQRLLLALALVNRPALIFLDEPSTGLDPQARRDLWRIIESIKAEGNTLVLTTHYMEEAQRLCDVVAIMDRGRIIAQDSPERLIERHAGDVTVQLPAGRLPEPRTDLPWPVETIGDRVRIRTGHLERTLAELIARQVDLSEMTVRAPNLENVFLNLTGRELRD